MSKSSSFPPDPDPNDVSDWHAEMVERVRLGDTESAPGLIWNVIAYLDQLVAELQQEGKLPPLEPTPLLEYLFTALEEAAETGNADAAFGLSWGKKGPKPITNYERNDTVCRFMEGYIKDNPSATIKDAFDYACDQINANRAYDFKMAVWKKLKHASYTTNGVRATVGRID